MVRGQINILARAPQHTANAPSAYEALALCATDCGPLSKIRPPMLFSVGSSKVLGPKMKIFLLACRDAGGQLSQHSLVGVIRILCIFMLMLSLEVKQKDVALHLLNTLLVHVLQIAW